MSGLKIKTTKEQNWLYWTTFIYIGCWLAILYAPKGSLLLATGLLMAFLIPLLGMIYWVYLFMSSKQTRNTVISYYVTKFKLYGFFLLAAGFVWVLWIFVRAIFKF